jgi:hypothetical protein
MHNSMNSDRASGGIDRAGATDGAGPYDVISVAVGARIPCLRFRSAYQFRAGGGPYRPWFRPDDKPCRGPREGMASRSGL